MLNTRCSTLFRELGVSFNGRTLVSKTSNQGSIPCTPAWGFQRGSGREIFSIFMHELVLSLKQKRALKSPQIIEAFLKTDRKNFVPENLKNLAYIDEALPIGEGQTISQPYTVAFMLELLEPRKGEQIMDIGYGSGWTTALLAEIVRPTPTPGVGVKKMGRVYAFEVVPKLCELGEENLSKYPELRSCAILFCKDAFAGVSKDPPADGFDGIIASAKVSEVSRAWRRQLKIGGRLVYPKNISLFKEVKKGENEFNVEEHSGFAFVPFIENG
jgi:protein-L-isoaspartate(D-aspartate) O-methyltransferase